MFQLPQSIQLLKRVALRLHVAAIGRRLYITLLIGCGLYAIFLLVSRLGGLYTEWVSPRTLLIVPALAALVALLWHNRPTLVDAARAVDRQHGTKDLFLTVALIEKSAGEYQALVARTAEEKAGKVLVSGVVPLQSTQRLLRAGVALALVAAAFLWLPGFDPFGKVEAARVERDRKKQLEESKKLTEQKIAQLAKEDGDGPVSE